MCNVLMATQPITWNPYVVEVTCSNEAAKLGKNIIKVTLNVEWLLLPGRQFQKLLTQYAFFPSSPNHFSCSENFQ